MITQVQLANELGVSQQAVSFALNGTGRLAEETRQRILEGADRLGYRKNMASVTMQTGRTRNMGLLVRERVRTTISHAILKGASTWLDDHDHLLSMVTVTDSQLRGEEAAPLVFREHRVDGCLVMLRKDASPRLLPMLQAASMPHIWVNEDLEKNAVYPDDMFLGRRGAEILMERGCRRLIYAGIDREGGHYSEQARWMGFQQVIGPGAVIASEGRKQVLDLLRSTEAPDGVLCYGKREADNWFAAACILGIRIPEDLRLLVIGDAGLFNGDTPYAVLRIPNFQTGARAMVLLQDRVENDMVDIPSEAVQHEQLDEGETL